MNRSRCYFNLTLALVCATFAFSTSSAHAQTLTFLTQFNGTDGTAGAPPIQATDGNFYGVADGGAYGHGEIFRMTPAGEITPIYSFCAQSGCPDGDGPNIPVLGSDGNLYGTTVVGGSGFGGGSFYRMTLDGAITILYNFCTAIPCTDGPSPSRITLASDGNFYGVAPVGGKFNGGTLFRLSPTGDFQLMYSFCSRGKCADGTNPDSPPLQGVDGNLYGVTQDGGSNGGGVVYELKPSGAYKVIHNFCGPTSTCEGATTPVSLVQDLEGNLYGTTAFGYRLAKIFKVAPSGQFRIVHTFSLAEGWNSSGFTVGSDGNLYGVADGAQRGATGGILFRLTPSGDFNILYTFEHSVNGYDPNYQPFQGTDGTFYGTTSYGPGANYYGTVYSFFNGLDPLVTTTPVAGHVGQSVLILGNNLTGTTSVSFNGVAARFTVESDTYIKATVPAGAKTGVVSVVTPNGVLNSNPQFVVAK